MRTTSQIGTVGLGAVAFGCFGALVHCGSSSGSPPSNGDEAHGDLDATALIDGGAEGDGSSASSPPPVPCNSNDKCSGASTVMCCNGFCADTAKDPANCGACGTRCTTNQFCTGTKCDDAVLSNVCINSKGTVAFDPYAEDNDAGASLGAALAANCTPAPSIVQVSQGAPGILDPATGRPILGAGNTLITGGGGYGQQGVAYMEKSIAPLTLWSDGTSSEIRNEGAALVTTLNTALTAHHDFFYVQLSVEPKSSTLCFSAVGMLGPGTLASGFFTATQIIPNRSNFPASWYVYEWTDTNNDSIPNAGDTFKQVAAAH